MAQGARGGRWLSVVGIGEDGWEGLSADARLAVESAELLFGGTRHLAYVPACRGTKIPWPSPMAPAIQEILTQHRGQRSVAVLASGDPMLYGVGVTLTRHLDSKEFHVIPQVSALSLACARLGWPVAEVCLISLVNRPIEQLYRFVSPGQRLILYSEDGSTPAAIAQALTQCGYSSSSMSVLEDLGGASERRSDGFAASWSNPRCSNLNLVAVTCLADAGAETLSLVPGLPDDAFETDGQLTKREVRAATLARLAPLPGERLWDVGAGTGTIGIEWMRVHPSCSCVAFEERAERADRILRNAKRLGVASLQVRLGSAPSTFEGLDRPNAIFIGGGLGNDGMFQACWDRLCGGGRLVANAVTVESEATLASLHKIYGGELVRILVARADSIGDSFGWRHLMPITQWTVRKP
ncbi:precorrin-6y C5,15-methyltransferase (decarboxylating) subunit CbiE [Granulicella sp. dw_53]|uniref:precorrin-6y C5,15-methyltransferase (decarboxylating) subunit CbiE n=1 Tax=Granulicella sp. dw_53 TaxID=2719792 RepID=UPI001BD63DA5